MSKISRRSFLTVSAAASGGSMLGLARAGEGIVRRVPAWRPELAQADLVICDMVGFGRYEATLKKLGKVTFSCSAEADKLELDRAYTMELFKEHGIGIPETYEFDSPEDAVGLVDIWEEPGFVIKPSGNAATSKTFVVRHPEQYKWALKQLSSDPLIVQALVSGIEISTEGWFNGRDWIQPFNHTFEEKKFLAGDKGPNTGCMGNVVVTTEGNKLVDRTLKKLTSYLKGVGYRGPMDVNAIVNGDQLYALEITARLGYDAIEALMEGLKEPVTDLFFETAVGVKKEMDITKDYMIAVRGSVPPWPHGEPDTHGMPVIGINEENLRHLYLTDVYKEDEQYLYAGGDGVVVKATAHGQSVEQAQSRVYRTLNNLTIQDMQYRLDIGNRVSNDVRLLKKWGWL